MRAVIVLAAGHEERWKGPTSKLVVPVFGEPVLARTLRLIRGRYDRLHVLARLPEVVALWPEATYPPHRWAVEAILVERPHWQRRTVVLLGDVAYSADTLDRILRYDGPVRFFGNKAEIFALAFGAEMHDKMAEALQKAVTHAEAVLAKGQGNCTKQEWKSVGKVWTCYRALVGLPMAEHDDGKDRCFQYQPAGDWTTDFDVWERYVKFPWKEAE